MSGAKTASPRVASEKPTQLNLDVYLTACAEKGATRQEDRAELFGMPRRTLVRYEKCKVEPRGPIMRRIATTLDRSIDDLWPAA